MKLRQKVVSMLLTIAMLLGLAPALTGQAKAATSGTCGENLTWTLDSDGTLTISGSGKMEDYVWTWSGIYEPNPPWSAQTDSIKKVSIKCGVTSIGSYAFSDCKMLTSIEIPSSISCVGICAFIYSENIKSVYIDSISDFLNIIFDSDTSTPLFNGGNLYLNGNLVEHVEIPDSVSTIENYAFRGCKSLISVKISNSVTSIGRGAFSDCSSLSGIDIPDSVTSIGDGAFNGCSSLNSIEFPDSITFISTHAFGNCSRLSSVKLPGSVTSIGDDAFSDCSSLSGIDIPDSVTSIGDGAFSGCSSLNNIDLPDSVTSIGNSVFSRCSNLRSIDLPKFVTSIGSDAFSDCSSLSNIDIPDSVTFIGDSVFSGCSNLSSLRIPDSVTYVGFGERAFYECRSLSSLNIPKCVSSIGEYAFYDCSSMSSIELPTSVTSIGDWAFSGCSEITCINIPNSVSSIGNCAFYGCSSLTSVSIPNSVSSIGNCAFWRCSNLISVGIPNSISSIGDETFYGCSSLTSVTIPDSVSSIGKEAFRQCSKLSSVYFDGAAPSVSGQTSSCPSFSSNVTLYYIPGKSGWTSPTWKGYKTATWDGKKPYGGVDSKGNQVYLKKRTPHLAFVAKNGSLSMTFNQNVRKGTGSIHFKGGSNSVSQYDLPVSENCVQVNGDTVTIALENLPLTKGGGYSVTIDSGAFVSDPEGIPFYGLQNKTTWLFAIYGDTLSSDGIDLQWEKSGKLWWQEEDHSKPAIPNGTREQYANALQSWAKRMWVSSITASNARELLDKPVYLPLKDTNGSMAQMFDKGTTVQQVMEDIVFLEQLKPYAQKLDAELKNVSPSSKLMFRFDQEAKAYKMAVSWYSQVNRYFEGRDEDSNFFLSIGAPLAYKTILKELSNAAGPYSKYVSPMLKSVFSGSELDSLKSLSGEKDYGTFKDSVAGL